MNGEQRAVSCIRAVEGKVRGYIYATASPSPSGHRSGPFKVLVLQRYHVAMSSNNCSNIGWLVEVTSAGEHIGPGERKRRPEVLHMLMQRNTVTRRERSINFEESDFATALVSCIRKLPFFPEDITSWVRISCPIIPSEDSVQTPPAIMKWMCTTAHSCPLE